MTRLLTILGALIAALICALTGAYVLWSFHSTAGLFVGVGLVLLGVAIAVPIPFHAGMEELKTNIVVLMPVIVGALRGGQRSTDPPPAPPVAHDPYADRPAIPDPGDKP